MFDTSPKSLVPRMLSHRENGRKSKFWQKSKEKNRFVLKIRAYKVKNSKLSHAGVPLTFIEYLYIKVTDIGVKDWNV